MVDHISIKSCSFFLDTINTHKRRIEIEKLSFTHDDNMILLHLNRIGIWNVNVLSEMMYYVNVNVVFAFGEIDS